MNTTLDDNGWVLLSAETRMAEHPDGFALPDIEDRCSLSSGMAAKLLFDIQTKENGIVIDRGVDRMWVIVVSITKSLPPRYIGILDNDPGIAENLHLKPGDLVEFGPEHICEIGYPPREYLSVRYSSYFE